MHKKEGGELTVRFTRPEEYQLLVIVEDNGVGREQSGKYIDRSREKQNKVHSLELIRQRLDTYNSLYSKFGVFHSLDISDLVSPSSEVIGTRVELRLLLHPNAD